MTSSEFPAWGRRQGYLDLDAPVPGDEPRSVHDRMLAIETLHRYAWAYDERDTNLLSEILADDVVFEGSIAASTPIGPISGRQPVVDWLRGHMNAQTDQRRHTMQNHIVTQQTTGRVRAVATLLLTSSGGSTTTLVTSGFYVMDVRREPDNTWRLSRIFAGFDCPF